MIRPSNAEETIQPWQAFTAEVLEIRELARVDGRQVWQVLLDHTEFVPEAKQIGSLEAISRSGAVLRVPVTATVEDANGDVWHTIGKPLQPGTTVRGSVRLA